MARQNNDVEICLLILGKTSALCASGFSRLGSGGFSTYKAMVVVLFVYRVLDNPLVLHFRHKFYLYMFISIKIGFHDSKCLCRYDTPHFPVR